MARNLHKEITDRILEHLKQGDIPWRKSWSGQSDGSMPHNGITKRAYSGVNVPLLWMAAQERSYSSSKWLTFKQALEAGGNVRKYEKGTMVVFVSTFDRENTDGKLERIPFLKAYTVFNEAQCDNITLTPHSAPINPDNRDTVVDEFVASTHANIINQGSQPCYRRAPVDRIDMPSFESFIGSSEYYSTLFHEMTHWSGAENRLNRVKGKRFGDNEYSFEELVAELGAAFLCSEFGFDNDVIENNAAYISHWTKILTNHENMFISAASHASKAVEYMRSLAIAYEPMEEAA